MGVIPVLRRHLLGRQACADGRKSFDARRTGGICALAPQADAAGKLVLDFGEVDEKPQEHQALVTLSTCNLFKLLQARA
jgi:hypothetical protein